MLFNTNVGSERKLCRNWPDLISVVSVIALVFVAIVPLSERLVIVIEYGARAYEEGLRIVDNRGGLSDGTTMDKAVRHLRTICLIAGFCLSVQLIRSLDVLVTMLRTRSTRRTA